MIVRLTGGLGNQMFMYAFGRGVSERRHEPLQFLWGRSTWDFGLEAFDIKIPLAIAPVAHNPVYDERTFAYDEGVYSAPRNAYYRGYWQTEKYFSPNFRKELVFKQPWREEVVRMADKLRSENSVFIHVRRGDYMQSLAEAYHGALARTSYYQSGEAHINERVVDAKFYLFSDDKDFCQSFMGHEIVTGFNQYEDMYLMSQCRHGVGANSTFSWWANWLGEYPGRICVAPKQWFQVEMDTRDIVPERWVKL
jgi:Glycosyl transferase family 11